MSRARAQLAVRPTLALAAATLAGILLAGCGRPSAGAAPASEAPEVRALAAEASGPTGAARLLRRIIGTPALEERFELGRQVPPRLVPAAGDREAIEGSLASDDAAIREAAALVLGLMPDAADWSVPGLRARLADRSERVVRAAVWSLFRVGASADAAPALARLLQHEDLWVRARTARALGASGSADPAMIAALVAALSDRSAHVRGEAARALGQIGAPAVAALVALLGDEQRGQVAGYALAQIGASAFPALLEVLKGEPSRARLGALAALHEAGPAAAAALAEASRQIREPELRVQVLNLIGGLGPHARGAVDTLSALIDETEGAPCAAAASALAMIGKSSARAVPRLIELTRSTSLQVRNAATFALGQVAPHEPHVVQALIEALAVDGGSLQAAQALALSGSAAVPGLIALLHDSVTSRRRAAVFCLKTIGAGDPLLPAELLNALRDPDAAVRRVAAEALGLLPEIDSRAALEAVLTDESHDVRQAARMAIHHLRSHQPE